MGHSYEIYRREANQHRAGQFALLIDGVDADITVNPAQFFKKSLQEVLDNGGKPDDPMTTVRANEICEEYAREAIQRRIDRLKAGSLAPGGVPLAEAGGLDLDALKQSDPKAKRRRRRETENLAVECFMNRGILKGLTKEQREDRLKRKAERYDHDADWRKRRAALIAKHEQERDELIKRGDAKSEKRIQWLQQQLERLKAPVLCASHGFQTAYVLYWTGSVDLVNDDIRIWPLMTNTTVDTERDGIDTMGEFSDLDEFDGSGYASGGLALDSQAVTADDANDRAEFDAADEVATLGAGTRSIAGILLGVFDTNTAGSVPLHWIEFSSAKTPDGSQFTFQFNAEGLLNMADA